MLQTTDECILKRLLKRNYSPPHIQSYASSPPDTKDVHLLDNFLHYNRFSFTTAIKKSINLHARERLVQINRLAV